jgi:hypothetical protein
MSALGLRCHNDAIAYVVLDGSRATPRVIDHGRTRMPRSDRGEQLIWLRQEVHEMLDRFAPTHVAFKAAENVARPDSARAEAEGVLQEAVHARGLTALRRIKSQMRADLGFERPARYINEALVGTGLEGLPANRHEAALVALAGLPDA